MNVTGTLHVPGAPVQVSGPLVANSPADVLPSEKAATLEIFSPASPNLNVSVTGVDVVPTGTLPKFAYRVEYFTILPLLFEK